MRTRFGIAAAMPGARTVPGGQHRQYARRRRRLLRPPRPASWWRIPTYVSIPMEIAVNRPAAEVWKRIGKYCDIGEWFQIPCTITQGKDGEFGAVRSVANEVLVGKTELSYTYTQPVREGRPVQPLSRHARGASGDGDDLEARLHAGLRQLDAGRRCGARARQGAANGDVHASAAEHEDPCRRRHAAARPATRRRCGRARWRWRRRTRQLIDAHGREQDQGHRLESRAFIKQVDERRRKDCQELVALMRDITGHPPKMWALEHRRLRPASLHVRERTRGRHPADRILPSQTEPCPLSRSGPGQREPDGAARQAQSRQRVLVSEEAR